MPTSKQKVTLLRPGPDATTFEEYNTHAYRVHGEELVSVRQIPPNRRSVTGLFPSRKTARMVPFESALERDFATVLEFSESVLSYETQPVEIAYTGPKGRPARGYPDFLVVFHAQGGAPMLCDVKYREEIFRRWTELKPRLKAARSYALGQGWLYRIKTEVEIRTPFLDNARFLLPYTRCIPDPLHTEILGTMLEKLQMTTIEGLLRACCAYEWNRAQLVPTLWALVGRRNFSVDLDQPLTLETPIWDPVWA